MGLGSTMSLIWASGGEQVAQWAQCRGVAPNMGAGLIQAGVGAGSTCPHPDQGCHSPPPLANPKWVSPPLNSQNGPTSPISQLTVPTQLPVPMEHARKRNLPSAGAGGTLWTELSPESSSSQVMVVAVVGSSSLPPPLGQYQQCR